MLCGQKLFAKKCLTLRRHSAIILTALAPVAQLDRVSDYESEGREFESLPAHQAPRFRGAFLFCRLAAAAPTGQAVRTPAKRDARRLQNPAPCTGDAPGYMASNESAGDVTNEPCDILGNLALEIGKGKRVNWKYRKA